MSDEAKGPRPIDPMVVARLGAARHKLKAAVKNLTGERDSARTEAARLAAENADLKTRADGSASARRVAELEQALRDRDHRAVFDKVARSKGVADDALELLHTASGYKASGEPDEAAIGALIDQQRARPGVSRLFGQLADPAAAAAPPATPGAGIVKPGIGSGQRGRTDTPAAAILAHDDPRLSDASYVMRNYDQIVAGAQERVSRGEV